MINFGAFQQGYNENEKILSAKRKENAALYSDFVKSNPGASADEREKFAGSLAGNNQSFRAILPSRETMEGNVARYNQAQSAAKASAARKRKLQDLEVAGKATSYYADLLQTTDAKTASEMTSGMFGDLLNPDMMPAVAAQANRVGWAKFQQDAAPLIKNFQDNPTQANLDSLNRAGFNTEWGDQLKKQYAPQLTTAKERAMALAAANVLGIAEKVDLDDDNVFRTQMEAELSKYNDLISPEQKMKIEADARGQLEARRGKRTATQTALAKSLTAPVLDRIGTEGFQTQAQIQRQLEAALAANSDLNGFDTTSVMAEAATMLDDKRQIALDEKNRVEQQTITENLTDSMTNRGYNVKNRNVIEDKAKAMVGKAGDGESEGQLLAQKTTEIENSISQLGNMGINVSDPDMVGTLTAAAIDVQKRESGLFTGDEDVDVPIEISHVAQAYDEMLLSGGVGAIEKMAVASALEELGFRSVSEAVKSGSNASLQSGIQTAMKELYTQIHDIYDDNQTTLDGVLANTNSKIEALDTQVAELGVTELLDAGGSMIDVPLADLNSDDLTTWQGNAKTALMSIDKAQQAVESEIKRLEALARDDFYNVDQQQAKAALARVEELKSKSKAISSQGEALAGQIIDAQQKFSLSATADVGGGTERTPDEVRANKQIKYKYSLEQAIEQIKANGGEVDPTALFAQLFDALQKEEDKTYLGTIQAPRGGGPIRTETEGLLGKGVQLTPASGPFTGTPNTGTAERLTYGNVDVPDYLPFMVGIFEELGLEPPTPDQFRIATEGMGITESIEQSVTNSLETIGGYAKYLFTGE
jgi:hypothetical protein